MSSWDLTPTVKKNLAAELNRPGFSWEENWLRNFSWLDGNMVKNWAAYLVSILTPVQRRELLHKNARIFFYLDPPTNEELALLVNDHTLLETLGEKEVKKILSGLSRSQRQWLITNHPVAIRFLEEPSDREWTQAVMADHMRVHKLFTPGKRIPLKWLGLAEILSNRQNVTTSSIIFSPEIKQKALKLWGPYWHKLLGIKK
jgi:hypothetical protein